MAAAPLIVGPVLPTVATDADTILAYHTRSDIVRIHVAAPSGYGKSTLLCSLIAAVRRHKGAAAVIILAGNEECYEEWREQAAHAPLGLVRVAYYRPQLLERIVACQRASVPAGSKLLLVLDDCKGAEDDVPLQNVYAMGHKRGIHLICSSRGMTRLFGVGAGWTFFTRGLGAAGVEHVFSKGSVGGVGKADFCSWCADYTGKADRAFAGLHNEAGAGDDYYALVAGRKDGSLADLEEGAGERLAGLFDEVLPAEEEAGEGAAAAAASDTAMSTA